MPVLAGCGSQEATQIGAVLPLTGEYQVYGQSIQKGIQLAFDELTPEGETSRWRLTVADSESNADKSKQSVQQLFETGATAVIGGVVTDEALQSVPVAERFDRVLLSPSASSPALTGISKQFYRVFISDSREGTIMAQFAVKDLEIADIVILATETTYATGIREVFQTNFERLGGEVVELIEVPKTASDFSGLVGRVITLDPSAVYLACYGEDIATMITSLRQRGFGGHILTTSAFASPAMIERVGSAAENVLLTQTDYDPESEAPHIQAFVEAFRQRHGLTPDLYAAHGYDALKVLVAAIDKAGGEPTEVWSGLRALREFPGVTGALQFNERGDVQKFPRIYRISESRLVDHKKDLRQRQEELKRRMEELQRRIAASRRGDNGP